MPRCTTCSKSAKGVRVGDQVIVRRAGDVIPEVVGVMASGPRPAYVQNFRMPRQCPICGSEVVREKGEANHRCTGGLFCAAQRKEAILHFAARRAMDIEGLGDKLVDQLVDANVIRTLPDLYRLGLSALVVLERMADRSALNLLAALEKSKQTTLPRFCLRWASGMWASPRPKTLAKHFGTLDALMGWMPNLPPPKSNCCRCPTWAPSWRAACTPSSSSPTTARWWSNCRACGVTWPEGAPTERARRCWRAKPLC